MKPIVKLETEAHIYTTNTQRVKTGRLPQVWAIQWMLGQFGIQSKNSLSKKKEEGRKEGKKGRKEIHCFVQLI